MSKVLFLRSRRSAAGSAKRPNPSAGWLSSVKPFRSTDTETGKGRALRVIVSLLIVLVFWSLVPLSIYNGALASSSSGAYKWVSQNPIPADHLLYATSAADGGNVWSVGDYGVILHWNGAKITEQDSGTTNNLYGVTAYDTTHVWAVGEAGTILFFDGKDWATQASPTSYDLLSVSAAGVSDVWAVGGYDGFRNAVILHYDGTSWGVQQSMESGGFTDVFALDASHVWAVSVWTWFYDGSGWSQINDGSARAPYQVSAVNAREVWAVDWDGTILRSTDGGATWNSLLATDWAASVSALESNRVWVVGWDGRVSFYNGVSWSDQSSGTTRDLYDVDSFNATRIFVSGDSTFLASTGAGWDPQSGGTTRNLQGVSGIDSNRVWSVGSGGTILYTGNGGVTWASQTSGVNNNLESVYALDSTHAWAVGANGVILFYNGSRWARQISWTAQNFTAVSASSTNHVWAVTASGGIRFYNGWFWYSQNTANQALYGVDAADDNHVWAVGARGIICHTTNGGSSWHYDTSPTANTLYSVSALDDDNAWAVGAGGVICHTTNGGANWHLETSPTTVTLNGVSAADLSHVWAVGENGTILFFDGTSWTQQNSPTTRTLNAVYARDANNAWAVGDNGTVIFADPPYIKACTPGYGNPGETVDVEIIGGYTRFQASEPTLTFGEGIEVVPDSVWVVDNTHILASVLIDPGASLGPRDVNAITLGEVPVPLAGGFVVGSDPAIASVSPNSAARGWTGDVEIVGSQTSFSPSSGATFGSGITVNSFDFYDVDRASANITVGPSASPGQRSVNVVTADETPSPLDGGFTVATPPEVISVSPKYGPAGETEVTVSGSGFGETRCIGGSGGLSEVRFNGLPAAGYTSWSDATITCIAPEGAKSGPVTVLAACGASNSSESFTPTHPTWFLAEGSNAWGFKTEIAVMNPNDESVTVGPTFMTRDGPVRVPDLTVPAGGNTVIHPGSDYDIDGDFSTKVECLEGKTIAADRTMYWSARGSDAMESHSSVGAEAPSFRWYFPEGSSAWGFECWILVQNPGDTKANCRVTYMIEGENSRTFTKTVPAYSRATFNMASDIGAKDASIMLESDSPVVAERSMYRDGYSEGSNSVGVTQASNDCYLAEGTAAWGLTTYVLVQNPNPTANDVTVTYMTPSGETKSDSFTMPANSRRTLRAGDTAGGTDFSIRVTGRQPVVAERAMYWSAGVSEACHSSVGVSEPHRVFYLPGCQVGRLGGRTCRTYILVQNPNGSEIQVKVSYLTEGGTQNVSFTENMHPNSRKSFDMAGKLGDTRASAVVECLTVGMGITAERSTYWGSNGAGANTIGCFDD